MCMKNGESLHHLLLQCEVARVLWDEISSRSDIALVDPSLLE